MIGSDGAKFVYQKELVSVEELEHMQPLTDWIENDDLTDYIANMSEANVTDAAGITKKSQCSKEELKAMLDKASKTKVFPPEIEYGSDLHVEFLYCHFTRRSPPELLMNADKEAWKRVIRKHIGVFDDRIGKMKCDDYEIRTKHSNGCRKRPYPMSSEKKLALEAIINVLLRDDCIERSTEVEFNAPALLVSKGDGRWRLVSIP